MAEYSIYKDIATRSGGDIYVGVVGPVRTGKSTFIKKFMELLVIPNIENDYKRARAMDELPQSGDGKTVMTTEPKFIPNEAVGITVGNGVNLRVRMIDCVGYMVDGALDGGEADEARMVRTPWQENPLPFEEAAEIGTKKVIDDHSTIGVVVTTDGSFSKISRPSYETAEKRIMEEMKKANKPFVVVLNTENPNSEGALRCKSQIEEEYGAAVIAVNCQHLSLEDVNNIMEKVLLEFPLKEIAVHIPKWVESLENGNWLKEEIKDGICASLESTEKASDMAAFSEKLKEVEDISEAKIQSFDLGKGCAEVFVTLKDFAFYKVLEEVTGVCIDGEGSLMETMREMADVKKKYDKIAVALSEVERTGYGIVSPGIDELTLKEPEITRQGSKFGIRLRASAPSLHIIRADVETEHLIYKMKMGIKSEKKYQDFEIEYRIAV